MSQNKSRIIDLCSFFFVTEKWWINTYYFMVTSFFLIVNIEHILCIEYYFVLLIFCVSHKTYANTYKIVSSKYIHCFYFLLTNIYEYNDEDNEIERSHLNNSDFFLHS